jgi:hypothetical protein
VPAGLLGVGLVSLASGKVKPRERHNADTVARSSVNAENSHSREMRGQYP